MRRNSTVIKLFGVGALILVMLIPLAMIRGVLSDRLERRNEAVSEITDSWGKAQNIIGPVLGVPFQYKFKSMKDTTMPDGHVERREVEEMLVANAFFLPELLKIVSDAQNPNVASRDLRCGRFSGRDQTDGQICAAGFRCAQD